MEYLTIGSVSAVIAALIAILQFIFPNALALILVSTLSDNHSAVTWSVVSRVLLSSQWPTFLRADSATSKYVAFQVNLITWSKPIGLVLIAVAAVVTPIGLYDSIEVSGDTTLTPFTYISDLGSMGLGTPQRSDLGFSRKCGSFDLKQCPGTTTVVDVSVGGGWYNTSIPNEDYDMRIPEDLAALYQSGLGTQMPSVSSFFDIQYRQYMIATNDDMKGQQYLQDRYRALTTMVLDGKIDLVEGLIVNMVNGGVGFRNHTAPIKTNFGAEWDEDILFLEPETTCVDTNMTLEYQLPSETSSLTTPTFAYLVDKGGFININKTGQYSDEWPPYKDAQNQPSLWDRAYKAAWSLNVLNMYYFNVSEPYTNRSRISSELGKRFEINATLPSFSDSNSLGFGISYTAIASPPSGFTFSNGTVDVSNITTNKIYSNPWGVTTANYSYIPQYCQGAVAKDNVSINNIQITCGLLYTIPRRLDGKTTLLAEPGSSWERGIYSCASTTKASIKSVRFRFNNTASVGLGKLEAISITEKSYANTSMMPIWGAEVPDPPMWISDVDPLWGIISPDKVNSRNLSTIRAPRFYLPASYSSILLDGFFKELGSAFLPGSKAPGKGWGSVYDPSSDLADYSGENNLQMFLRWQELSKNVTGSAHLLNLIWSDYAANGLVGTRSWLSDQSLPPNLQKRDSDTSQGVVQVPVHLFQRKIHYHWVFGIPAFLSVLLALITCVVALIALLSGRGSISRMRYYMWQLSSGRILGSIFYPWENDQTMQQKKYGDTKLWLKTVGNKPVPLNVSITEGNNTTGEHIPLSQMEQEENEHSDVTEQLSRPKHN